MITVIKAFADPLVLVFVLMIAALIRTRRVRKQAKVRLGWYCLLTATVLLYLLGSNYISTAMLYSLESRYPPAEAAELADLDMVVILAGGASTASKFRAHSELSGITYSRVVGGVTAFKRSGAEILIMSGGAGTPGDEPAAEAMKRLAVELGVPAEKIVTQRQSRTTMEDAAEVAKLRPGKARRIGVATSALHMWRAEKAFSKVFADDEIVPVPVNYLYSPMRFKFRYLLPGELSALMNSRVVHEYIGITWYKLRYGS